MSAGAPAIAVLGAGIGGLAAALFLSRAGFPVTLIEKRTRVEEEGAGLQLSPNASHILIAAGLGPALARRASAPERIRIRNARTAREIATIPLGDQARKRYGAPYLVIHRADLAGLLLDAVRGEQRIQLLYGREAHGCTQRAESIAIALRSERGATSELEFAAAIAADGLWSGLTGETPPRFSGFAAWRALLPAASAPALALSDEVGLWLAPQAHLVHYPVRDGKAVNIVAVVKEKAAQEGWSRQGDATLIRSALAGWSTEARQLIGAAPDWRNWSLFDRKPRRRWGSGSLTLLGDAAHAMLPFLAQGAAMAIEDAAVLARELAPLSSGGTGREIGTALRRYERARRARTARAQQQARRNMFSYHAPWPFGSVRDTILRRSSGERLLARYDWLYGWRVDAGPPR
ncbi:salicylate hydroxylase [Rhizobiales bacterium GAS188]|nr:salicylate hydroxylase [Rhizobiales bacterium GAS188]